MTELVWKNGKVVSLKVKSTIGGNLRLRSNTPLKLADGTALTAATGNNSNQLMQPYVMPDPIVVNPSKIPATSLPTTYLYDIPTTAGQEIELIDRDETSAIITIQQPDQLFSGSPIVYAVDGRQVSDNYRGLVIVNGQKFFRK